MTTSSAVPASVISARFVSRTRVNTIALVVGFALLTALLAQIEFPLWFTPVPITGQTLAVLLAGAALGARLGAMSQALYVALGAVGFPFYSGGDGGWEVVTGATGGYLVGFVVAAALVGYLAERGQDRTVVTALVAFLAGSAVIYLFGVTWLAASLDVGATEAMELGLVPFVIGDLLKIALAGLALPLAWRLAAGRE
jgi:biotin transport system substrate-specific component